MKRRRLNDIENEVFYWLVSGLKVFLFYLQIVAGA
jgi:hypothetical protein